MGIKFIQQTIDKDRQFFTGFYPHLTSLFENHRHIMKSMFPNNTRLVRNLERQGFASVLVEELNIEYRIEVDE
jgi:hypothetical protein